MPDVFIIEQLESSCFFIFNTVMKGELLLLRGKVILPLAALFVLFTPAYAFASEADLVIPEFEPLQRTLLMVGIIVCILGFLYCSN